MADATEGTTTLTAGIPSPQAVTDGRGDNSYTGVIIIHGFGDIKRNTTLQEAVDSLTSWFTQRAGFALRPAEPKPIPRRL